MLRVQDHESEATVIGDFIHLFTYLAHRKRDLFIPAFVHTDEDQMAENIL